MKTHVLFATVLLAALPLASLAAAVDESTPARQQEVSNPAPGRDAEAAPVEGRAVPDSLQAARTPNELSFGDIKILPSF